MSTSLLTQEIQIKIILRHYQIDKKHDVCVTRILHKSLDTKLSFTIAVMKMENDTGSSQ
jgi:hypothetical protein